MYYSTVSDILRGRSDILISGPNAKKTGGGVQAEANTRYV
jgi:hypothetical protein